MRAVIRAIGECSNNARPLELTLLELVNSINEYSHSEEETVAAVVHLLASGRVRLRGNFRLAPVSDFF